MLIYLLKVMLMYTLVFTGIFHLVRLTKSIKSYQKSAMYATVILIVIFLVTQVARFSLGWIEVPDGRYLLIAFAAYYLGLWPLIATITTMLLVNAIIAPYRLLGLLIIKSALGLVFLYLRQRFYLKGKRLTGIQIIVSVVIIIVVPLVLSNLIFVNEAFVMMANRNLVVLLVSTYVIIYTVFKSIDTEVERERHIKQIEEDKMILQHQNEEIVALNEEMLATEEALRENYDALEGYKNRVEYYAFHDPKTGFFNRDYLLTLLENRKNSKDFAPYHVLVINVCELHDYQEKLGQTLFEMLHYKVGTTLQSIIEEFQMQDAIQLFVLSMGRFSALVTRDIASMLNEMYAKATERLRELELIEGMTLNVSVSIGALEVKNPLESPHVQLDFAESAAQEAGNRGRTSLSTPEILWFYQDLYDRKQYEAKLTLDMKNIDQMKDFYIVYQPQVNQKSEITSYEALLRWNHPDYGNISPVIFIPLAEKLGIIHKLGTFVQETVMSLQSKLSKEQLWEVACPIAINVSLLELMDPNYAHDFLKRLSFHDIAPELITIELTESAFSNELEDVLENTYHLANAGVRIQLDDFGTAYASIRHLSLFPLSAIKIDKSFIDYVTDLENQKTRMVIFSMIEMAHKLNLPIVAEGVETNEQFKELMAMGCDLYQGYYFSKPVPESALFSLKKNSP